MGDARKSGKGSYDSEKDSERNDSALFHLGFFYRTLIYTHWVSIALYFDEYDQKFKYCFYQGKIERGIIPYNLVLIKGVSNTKAELLLPVPRERFLESIDELSYDGIQIVYERGKGASLYNGKDIIDLTRQESSLLYIHVIKLLKEADDKLIRQSKFGLYQEDFLRAAKEIEQKVKQVNLSEILKDLHVFVEESFICRPGKDDYYVVYKTVTIGCPEDELDGYLKNYIGLGKRKVHMDSGFTSAYNMAIKGLVTGDYDEEEVNKERERLISQYSSQDHIYHNISEYVKQHVWPSGLNFQGPLYNFLSRERNTLIPLFWKLLRGKYYSDYFNALDKTCSWKGFSEESLVEINENLSEYSIQTRIYREIVCPETDPMFSVI